MTIAVRPWSRRSRPFSIVFSVRTSTLEVASSRIRMRGSASRARAKATSWRWPAESWTPRSPTSVSIPSGRAATNSVAPTVATRRLDLLQARLRPAEGDVLADAAGEEEALLGDDPELAPQRPLLDPAQVVAVDQHRAPAAGRRSGRRAWRRSTCRRRWRRPGPGSGRAGRAGRRPAAPRRRLEARRRLGGVFRVGEPDALHARSRPSASPGRSRPGRRPCPARCRAGRRSCRARPSPAGRSCRAGTVPGSVRRRSPGSRRRRR